MKLSDREQNIVMAAIRLWNVNAKHDSVPDYELTQDTFLLKTEEMRAIRDIVQDISRHRSRRKPTRNEGDLERIVVRREVVSETWRKANPNHCPVVLRDGDGKSVGACWHYLRDGVCPSHGQIYEHNVEVIDG